MLSPGVLLSDRYRLTECVAAGGMGEVWRGTDVLLRREVAVKVLLPALVSDAEFIARFRTEARMMASLRHPGIVQVYDYGEEAEIDGSRLDYLVMEYVEGAPLSEWIKSAGKLGVTETMSVVTQAAEALHVAHSAGIVHRDVKPSNLLVRPDGVVVLVDFGVARSTETTGLTATNMVLGTADYMAPEQAVGQPVSAATDIYALGAVAYCCLAGRPPFTGDNPLQVVSQHLQSEPPTLPAWEIPASVAALVSRALAKEPADRYPSAAAFAEAARSAQTGPAADSALRGGPAGAYPRSGQSGPPSDSGLRGGRSAAWPGSPQTGPSTNGALHGGSPTGSGLHGGPSAAWPRSAQSGPPTDGALSGGPSPAYPRSAQSGPPAAYPYSVQTGPSAGGAPSGGPSPAYPYGPSTDALHGGPAAGYGAGGARNGPATGPMRNRPPAAEPAGEQPLYFPPQAPTGNRRRNSTLIGVAAVVVIGLIALIAFIAFRSGPAQSQGRPTQRAGDDIRNPGGGPGSGPGSQVVVPPNGGPIPPVQSASPPKQAGQAGQTARPGASVTTPSAAATTKAAGTPKPTTTTATAATSNPYTPGQVCGSGYQVIDSATLTATGATVATVYLLYNSSSGSNCTTTLKTTAVGSKTKVTAYLEVQGGSRSTDSGSFSYYAGPVRAKAAGVCVKWGGSAGGANYDSPFEHCD